MITHWAIPSILSAVLLALAFPPYRWPFLAWIALIPLFLQLHRVRVLSGFFAGFLCGTLFYMILMSWTALIDEIDLVRFVILGIALGSFFGLFAALGSWLSSSLPRWTPLSLPVVWVSIEYLQNHIGFLSQSFGILGYSQYSLLTIAGIAAYTGVWGVSFLLVASNALLAAAIARCSFPATSVVGEKQRRLQTHLLFILLFCMTAGLFGLHAMAGEPPPGQKTLTVALVQGNVQAAKEKDYQGYRDEILPVYERLTRNIRDASLIVWPSSSVPGVLPGDHSMVKRLGNLAQETGAYLLVGAAGFDKFNPEQRQQKRIANSAFLFSPSGLLQGRYDKIRLLPFDEFLPWRDVIPWPEWLIKPGMTDHYPGKELTVFEIGRTHFGVQICFENMFPDQARELVHNGADFLVGQTNESYIHSLGGMYQNLAYYVFRAIENRVPVLRSSTTGISSIIDAEGQIIVSVEDETGRKAGAIGTAKADILIGHNKTFYTRYGDLFAYLCIIISSLLIAKSFFDNKVRTFVV